MGAIADLIDGRDPELERPSSFMSCEAPRMCRGEAAELDTTTVVLRTA